MKKEVSVSLPQNLRKTEVDLFSSNLYYTLQSLTVKKLSNVFITYTGYCLNHEGLIKECHHDYPHQFSRFLKEASEAYYDSNTMIKAVALDKPLIIDLLTRSFQKNKSVNYIVRYNRLPERGIYALMDYSFEVCLRYGEVWIADSRKACALILFSHLKRTTLKSIFLDFKLIGQAIGLRGISNALSREAKIKAIQPKISMAYLWFIGLTRSTSIRVPEVNF